jgi:hypothetical protein
MSHDYYYRPPATYDGSESLEAQLTRKRGLLGITVVVSRWVRLAARIMRLIGMRERASSFLIARADFPVVSETSLRKKVEGW